MINPKHELFRWGPIDGRIVYIESFFRAFKDYPGFIDGSWPDVLGAFRKDKVTCIADYPDLRNAGENLFKKFVFDGHELKEKYDSWIKTTLLIKKYETEVNKGLSKLSDNELKNLFSEWDEVLILFWLEGFLPELSNWGGEQMLRHMLEEKHNKNFVHLFEILSAPEDLSFFQKEELEFLNILLLDDEDDQMVALLEHSKKYYWLRNSYGETKELDFDYFKRELDKLSVAEARRKIDEISAYVKDVKRLKEKAIIEYHVSAEIEKTAHKLSFCIWWQDFRKEFIFIANHIITKFIEEISFRKSIPKNALMDYCAFEIVDLLENGKILDNTKRKEFFSIYYTERKEIEYNESVVAEKIMEPFFEVSVDHIDKKFLGIVVSKGKCGNLEGEVRILLTPKDVDSMKEGEILVASMTSPDFIVAMRKASAIITDEGGMTSHAAIVSRELGKLCIVGTKVATKVLKDGDVIQLDASTGTIEIIEGK